MSFKHIAIIPARGGSKGLHRKNLKLLDGHPLVGRVIQHAQDSKCIDHLIVSTDDNEIASVAKSYGAIVPFIRPQKLSEDLTTTEFKTTNSSIEDETEEERNSVPLWVTILICFSLLLCILIAAALYLKQRKPEIWKSIKNKIPVVSRQNFYQVSPLSSCRRQYGINVITNCLPSKTLSSIFNIKSLRSSKEEPSRDTCFLCMRKVPTKNPNFF